MNIWIRNIENILVIKMMFDIACSRVQALKRGSSMHDPLSLELPSLLPGWVLAVLMDKQRRGRGENNGRRMKMEEKGKETKWKRRGEGRRKRGWRRND